MHRRFTQRAGRRGAHFELPNPRPPVTSVVKYRMRFAFIFLPALAVAGCSSPTEAQIQADFERHHPGCVLLGHGPGEGDSDNVYVEADFECSGNRAKDSMLYQKIEGQWQFKASPKPTDEPGA